MTPTAQPDPLGRVPAMLAGKAVSLGRLLAPATTPSVPDRGAIETALLHPVWPEGRGPTVFDTVNPGESVCFVISDHTRKTATDRVLPVILDGLCRKGCADADMYALIASGIHRHPGPEEIRKILGPQATATFGDRVFFHDPDDDSDLVDVGTTRRGNRVRLQRRTLEADRLILLGAATYHYHAGFGGGRKSLVPGLAARETIAANHSLTLDPEADRIHPGVDVGRLDGNPVAEEMLESASLCRPDIIVNTVLSPDGQLAGVFSGGLDIAHRAACRLVERVCRVDIDRTADLVVASAGTASNWIQSHKALFNASRCVHEHGRIVLVAPCPEGLGNERFRHWVTRPSLDILYRELRCHAEVLGQTALSTRMRGQRTILVSELCSADTADLGMDTAPDVPSALDKVLSLLADQGMTRPTYYLMPQARATVPFTR